jgi:hypothetical protein
VSLQSKKAVVAGLIDRLALQTCRSTRIGHVLDRGISGGEVTRIDGLGL